MTTALFPDAVITADLLPHLRLDGRFELIDGRIEPLTPTNLAHALAMTRISALLLARLPGYQVLSGDPGITLAPKTVRAPDVLAISDGRRRASAPGAYLTVPPELVVEIVSPSNAPESVMEKVFAYLAFGVDTVWVVNLDTGTVEVYMEPSDPRARASGLVTETTLPNGTSVRIDELLGPM